MSDELQDVVDRSNELLIKHRGAKAKNWLVALWSLASDRTGSMPARLDRAVEIAPESEHLFAGIISLSDGRKEAAAQHFRALADSLDGGEDE